LPYSNELKIAEIIQKKAISAPKESWRAVARLDQCNFEIDMSKFGRRIKQAPEGFEYVEPTLTALENELRESMFTVCFIIIMQFLRQRSPFLLRFLAEVNEPHEGLRKTESQWPIHQINWQKSRYIYDMYYTYGKISKEVYDYCITNKIVDAQLIAKWKKPGYERLCSTYVINPRNYKFGTVSICRVPKHSLAPGTEIEDPMTGCRGCASGSSHNIFGNKYGQYLAAIQVAREERIAQRQAIQQQLEEEEAADRAAESDNDDERSDSENSGKASEDEDLGPVGAPDGSSGPKKVDVWASADQEREVALEDGMIGELSGEAKREAMLAASKSSLGKGGPGGRVDSGPAGKRARPV
jgi:bud site selection protein 31